MNLFRLAFKKHLNVDNIVYNRWAKWEYVYLGLNIYIYTSNFSRRLFHFHICSLGFRADNSTLSHRSTATYSRYILCRLPSYVVHSINDFSSRFDRGCLCKMRLTLWILIVAHSARGRGREIFQQKQWVTPAASFRARRDNKRGDVTRERVSVPRGVVNRHEARKNIYYACVAGVYVIHAIWYTSSFVGKYERVL